MPPLHAQGTAIIFGGVALARYQRFAGSFRAGTKVINAMSGEVENGTYLPVIEPTTREQKLSVEGLAAGLPLPDQMGAAGELSITNPGWSIPLGLFRFTDYTVEGRVGEYLRVTFDFIRTSRQ